MKIGILGPFPPLRGGIAAFNSQLAMRLGRQLEVVPMNFGTQYPRLIFPGVTQLDCSDTPFPVQAPPVFYPFRPWRWRTDREELAAQDIDVLLLSWWTPIFAPAMSAFIAPWRRLPGKTLAIICHNVAPHESIPFGSWFQKRLLAQADLLIAHWRGDSRRLLDWFPKKRVLSLFHPLYEHFPDRPEVSRAEARHRLGVPAEATKVLLFFGLIRPYKGFEVLLQAFEALHRADSGYHLVVAGEFYEKRRRFEPLLGRLQQSGCLTLADRFIPNELVYLYFRAADVVVLPYRHATQSGIIPLAYAWNRGVVSTRVGGLSEMVAEGRSGFLVEPDDPAGLVCGVEKYLAHQTTVEAELPGWARQFGIDAYLSEILAALA